MVISDQVLAGQDTKHPLRLRWINRRKLANVLEGKSA
jgi:hypothetical protein